MAFVVVEPVVAVAKGAGAPFPTCRSEAKATGGGGSRNPTGRAAKNTGALGNGPNGGAPLYGAWDK